ncbi:MAG: hypothetical protein EZS28_031835 [Streblomastix strix]|uniref:Uncharacterized protein n=1 Tax=Streblomastix strix TaxID=222440 RepID=A0A5J4UQE7_9EUKA|nr:MAG: hypothetical protein EZS28_031835 [Streblomastix strix]
MAKIVGVQRQPAFDLDKIIPSDAWRRSAETNRWRYENLQFIQKPADMQPDEVLHICTECARAVSFAKCALIAEIHHLIPEEPPSRDLIDAYLMCLTAGARLRLIRLTQSAQEYNRNQALKNYRNPTEFPLITRTPRNTEGAIIQETGDIGSQTTIIDLRVKGDTLS